MTLMDITPPSLVELQKQFYNRGVLDERERIDAILDGWEVPLCKCDSCKAVKAIRNEIKGEQK